MTEIRRSYARILMAAIAFLVIAQIIHFGGVTISMDYYTHPNYGEVWSPLLVSFGNIYTGLSFFYVSIIFGFFGALLFCGVFTVLGKSLDGSPMERGVAFGVLVFLVANVPGSLSMFLLLNLPLEIVILWTLESFIGYIIGGALVGKMLVIQAFEEKQKGKKMTVKDRGPEWMKQMDSGEIK